MARAAEAGLAGWVEEQLAPDALDDFACHLRLRNLETPGMTAQQRWWTTVTNFDDVDRQTIPTQLRQGALLRQAYSRRQLYEALVSSERPFQHRSG
ncbi:MAG: hypothetical protein IPN59_13345 [Holophaga sp.]|nr:hypothetical protein [Holophaga sp.]